MDCLKNALSDLSLIYGCAGMRLNHARPPACHEYRLINFLACFAHDSKFATQIYLILLFQSPFHGSTRLFVGLPLLFIVIRIALTENRGKPYGRPAKNILKNNHITLKENEQKIRQMKWRLCGFYV